MSVGHWQPSMIVSKQLYQTAYVCDDEKCPEKLIYYCFFDASRILMKVNTKASSTEHFSLVNSSAVWCVQVRESSNRVWPRVFLISETKLRSAQIQAEDLSLCHAIAITMVTAVIQVC